ncbi:DUF1847 domain-containing protein [Clostridium sp. 'deep sea']|uniref:DUF1847 domain-containing protein n=1 Tax=Clostridium sp. 'deep sea' TaxID=2779445 RepID=UPI00189656D1|nr:DUF1847 domain-containing protein [Clostridium sp. 'deep sea']QOR35682.1 DUF1847 domain-containing protein [Clostridium sp. 'deep sea']
MVYCAWCKDKPCSTGDNSYPANCPNNNNWMEEVKEEYRKEENNKIFKTAAYVEKTGYGEWTRLQEIKEFSKKNNYEKLGLAFCQGLGSEAKIVADYFKHHGFEVISVVCCTGAVDKTDMDIPEQYQFEPSKHESMCNPIGQAFLLNKHKTDFNIVLGLCVGHDSLFFKYSEAPTTVLAVKDRVLGHNPLAAVYCSNWYYKNKLLK